MLTWPSLVDVAGVAADAEAGPAVGAAAVAADRDAAVAAVTGLGVGGGGGVLVQVGGLGVVLVADLGAVGLLGGGLVLDDVLVEVDAWSLMSAMKLSRLNGGLVMVCSL